jgi:hypothetical protein
MNGLKTFTIREKENGEFAHRNLTGLAKLYNETTDPLNVYEVEDEGFYYTNGSSYVKDAHGPYTLEQLQDEFTALYLAGAEYLFYVHTKSNDFIIYSNDGDVKYYIADDTFPDAPDAATALEFLYDFDLDNVNPWKDDRTIEQLLDGAELLAEYLVDCL